MTPRWRHGVPGKPFVVAHRGYSAAHPENSPQAFAAAIAAGADLIETDVRLSRDGVLVCNHDRDLLRVKNIPREVAALSADELAALSVVDLAQVLEMARRRVGVLLDVKLKHEDLPALILEQVRRLEMDDQVVFGLSAPEQVRALKRRAPGVASLGLLRNYDEFLAFFAAGGDIARLWEEDVNESTLELARGRSRADGARPVWVTTGLRKVGEAPGDIDGPRLKILMEKEIDGLLVNDPAQALRARGEFQHPSGGGESRAAS